MDSAGWEMQQAEDERYAMAVEALQRCIQAGAKPEDIQTLAAACGVDIRYTTIGGE